MADPTPQAVATLFTGILGKSVTAAKGAVYNPTAVEPRMIAVFRGDESDPIWVCLVDLALTAYAGAALVMLPAEAAKEVITKRQADESLGENFAEILNICSQLFTTTTARPVRLQETVWGKGAGQAPAGAKKPTPAFRLDMLVKIAGYGDGKLSLLRY